MKDRLLNALKVHNVLFASGNHLFSRINMNAGTPSRPVCPHRLKMDCGVWKVR